MQERSLLVDHAAEQEDALDRLRGEITLVCFF
jgi:hypothetical protein